MGRRTADLPGGCSAKSDGEGPRCTISLCVFIPQQALNNLQSTFSGFGFINSENVFKVQDWRGHHSMRKLCLSAGACGWRWDNLGWKGTDSVSPLCRGSPLAGGELARLLSVPCPPRPGELGGTRDATREDRRKCWVLSSHALSLSEALHTEVLVSILQLRRQLRWPARDHPAAGDQEGAREGTAPSPQQL